MGNDFLSPDVLIIPSRITLPLASSKKGDITISGAKLYFYNGSDWALITSA